MRTLLQAELERAQAAGPIDAQSLREHENRSSGPHAMHSVPVPKDGVACRTEAFYVTKATTGYVSNRRAHPSLDSQPL